MVIGSDDGQIRLYGNKTLTRANTAIPGLGGPITAVDVTYDGKWVLATTKNYLMVVKTTYKVLNVVRMASVMMPNCQYDSLWQDITCWSCLCCQQTLQIVSIACDEYCVLTGQGW